MTTGPEHTSILPVEPDRSDRQPAASPTSSPGGSASTSSSYGSGSYGSTASTPSPSGVGSTSTRPAADFSQDAVLARQKEKSGGLKLGSGFFGWVVATALFTFLVTVATAIAAAVTLSDGTVTTQSVLADLQRIGLVGGIVAIVILLLSYFAGGYVAGRMARFSGAKQGLAVWLWAVVISVILGVVGYFVGRDMTVPTGANLPRVDFTGFTLDTQGIIALAVVVLVPLIGAILGGLAGMPYHRRADRAGWTIDEPEA